jgi:hypothetical protein
MKSNVLTMMMLACVTFLFSCSKEDNTTNNDGMGTFQVRMTDAPGPYDQVNIDLQSVEVNTDATGWHTLTVNSGMYNLLDYMNGNDTLIASSMLGAGHISQIRLILGPNSNVVVNGVTYDLTTPSAEQSGLKINIDQQIDADVTYAVLLDFDAARSIHQTGNGKYMLKPVIRAVAVGLDGVIRGTVGPVSAVPVIYAINGTDTTGAFIDATGQFMIQGLATGNYTLVVQPVAPFVPLTINNVSVTAGNTTNVGIIAVTQ